MANSLTDSTWNYKKVIILLSLLACTAVAIYLIVAFVNPGGNAQNDDGGGFDNGNGFGPGQQDWGFVDVREGAHIFWWLYFTTADNITDPTDRPLAIWLQGGPGSSSTGYGNFAELGPLDLQLNLRNFTWVKDMNVLFIDSPVGSGFSYVDDVRYLTTNNSQAVDDLVETLRGFYAKHREFESVPLHIFSESYGGKVSVEFAYVLNQAIQAKTINCNLKSVASIDGWISSLDSMWSWAPFLLHMGFVDEDGYDSIMASTNQTEQAFNAGRFSEATNLWGWTENVILTVTHGIDFYNVLRPQPAANTPRLNQLRDIDNLMYRTLVTRDADDDLLEEIMQGPVTEALNIPEHVVWGSQSGVTFRTLYTEFMKPVINYVELLLNETTIDVSIITGQLDLIVATPGTVNWVNKVQWDGREAFYASQRKPIGMHNIQEGFYKEHANLALYWINRAGHMVPFDNPEGMDFILRRVTKYNV